MIYNFTSWVSRLYNTIALAYLSTHSAYVISPFFLIYYTDALYYKTLELQRKAESYFQPTKSAFSSDTRQSMKRRIITKHLTEPK